MLRRWTDLGFAQSLAMLDAVVPVVQLGADRTDIERVVYVAAFSVSSGGGQVPSGTLSAQDRDVELVAAWASRSLNALGLNVYFTGAPPFAGSNSPLSSTTAVPPTANVLGITGPPVIVGALGYEAAAGVTIELPLRGVVVPRGRRIVLESDALSSTMNGGFCWRELDNR